MYMEWLPILLNCGLRTYAPSQYVPLMRTSSEWYGSPYLARVLAIWAEYTFYKKAASTFGLRSHWEYTGILWRLFTNAELLSCIALLTQSEELNLLEDICWGVWFVLLYYLAPRKHNTHRQILLPVFAAYYCHIQQMTSIVDEEELYGSGLTAKGHWVQPSVIAKLIYFGFFSYMA